MFEQLLVEQNPHWQGRTLSTGIPREAALRLWPFVAEKQIIVITGIRRCGKSTLLKQLLQQLIVSKHSPKNILFLNVEHPLIDAYRKEVRFLHQLFEEFLSLTSSEGSFFCFLDEVQFFENWPVFVKARYETGLVKFFLTGSNSWLLSSEYASILSGRTIQIELFPFSFREYLAARGIILPGILEMIARQKEVLKHFPEYLSWGGFPEVVFSSDETVKRELLANYYQNILLRDIVPRFAVANVREMQELARYLLSHISTLFSYAQLAKLVGITDKTVKEYLYYFSQAYLLFEVNQYFPSLRRQMSNLKKIYAGDVGFAHALGFRFSEDRGRFLENVVFLELKRRKKEVYYTKGKYECDFVVRESGKLTEAFQVCFTLTSENQSRELAGLQEAMQQWHIKKGYILTFDQEERRGTISVLPLWKWLLAPAAAKTL